LDKKNYTSEDVAQMAGVSQSTVSRVFAGGANVSEKKRKKILEIADKLDYQPNAHARSLITRKTRIIGIVMRNIRDPFYSAVLEIFYNRLSVLGYDLVFINSENEEIQENEILRLLEYNIQGIIISDATLSAATAKKLERNDVEVLLFNRYVKNAKFNAVYCDNYLAAKQIATYLVEHGHKSFAFISGTSNTSTTIDRLKGFEEVLKDRNINDLVIESGNYSYESGFKAAQELMTKNREIDCIFCVNDITALGAMDAIRTIGLKIPEDVSVVGFDNIRMGEWPTYSLTTWEQPLEDMVTTAVQMLLGKINDKDTPRKALMMKGQMIVRNTVKIKK
jgi:DNA-binding LacI/PurR family transcriptional regulator